MSTEQSYSDAIEALMVAVYAINRPLGDVWGLQRGQAGWHIAVRCRNDLEQLAADLQRFEPANRRS